ncbi:probable aspartic proteinase GIP2 [Vicia villosa]|uniref:probable aspartic proteinase GIP2 n=1 Tax=Vicia villosa TaxID=3911 RepID=UPI00273B14C5|nr:probable aspartic proteinase GIP2 [Vicia villosa]
MATSSTIHFFLLSLSLLSLSSSSLALTPKPNSFILPIAKDPTTLQYSTTIKMGTPATSLDLVIDISERFIWFECDNSYNSSTYHPIQCGSKKCKLSKGTECITCTNHPFKTGCTNNTCALSVFNPIAQLYVSGDIGEDILSSLRTTADDRANVNAPRFISSCVYPDKFGVQGFLQGLAKGKKGILGLARTLISLPTQLATRFKLERKFTLCLPSSSKTDGLGLGSVFIGGGPYHLGSNQDDFSKFLTYTPLIANRHSTGPIFDNSPSTEYFIKVNSIKVDNNVVNYNTTLLSINRFGGGGTKLSTVVPHTKLHTLIYQPLVNAFVKKAEVRKIKRVKSIAPFGACFDSRTIGKSITGPNVPTIDLVLKGGVQWRINGANSMVKVNENVLCLGFVEVGLEKLGGLEPSFVIGGHQLEDNLLEFDLFSSKLGFSSSLLLNKASCSCFRRF